MSDSLSFSSEFYEEAAAEVAEAAVAGPVDPEHLGFGSLLTALQAHRAGQLGREVLERYHAVLAVHLQDSLGQLEGLEIPGPLVEVMAPVVAATRGLMERMGEVLALVRGYLDTGEEASLDQATAILAAIHGEIRESMAILSRRSESEG
ncbi:MAG TPA: hypothetical protein VNO81_05560 [Candidatus Nitrosotenuis sp.]|nr:hypothetical protein [Candidatus Nitrosotenuis sp.]